MSITVKAAQDKRDELESAIAKAISDLVLTFEQETGLNVQSVSIDARDIGTMSERSVIFSCDVRLDI